MFADQKFSKSAMLAFRDIARAESKEEYDEIIQIIKDKIYVCDMKASQLLDSSIDAHEKAEAMQEEVERLRSIADYDMSEANRYQEKSEEYSNLLKFINIACKPRF